MPNLAFPTQAIRSQSGNTAELGANWQLQFADADGLPLNMTGFEEIDFGAISYKEIFQNVKTILATPLYSAALERTLGIDQTIVDQPINREAAIIGGILAALTYWEPRVSVMNIDFDYTDALNGHLTIALQLKIDNVIYGTTTPYTANRIYEKYRLEGPVTEPTPGPVGDPGPPGPPGTRGSLWYVWPEDPDDHDFTGEPTPQAHDIYMNSVTGDLFVFTAADPDLALPRTGAPRMVWRHALKKKGT